MPKYEYNKTPYKEEILGEIIITEREAAKMMGIDREKVYFRIVHELTTDAPPWAVVRIQAVKK